MASFSFSLLMIAMAVLISPALSLNCTSHKFSDPSTTFAHCMDLPTQNAQLHWTHAPAANTLSIAFTVANPSRVWVAWALNPTMSGMMGAQSFIASQNGSSLVVNTYNISSTAYQVDGPSNISYTVHNMSADHVNGTTTIFAALELPPASTVLTQVWQVGLNGTIGMHGTTPQNLASAGKLTLAGATAASPAGSPAGSPPDLAASPGPTAGGQQGGGNGTSSGGGPRVVLGLGSYGVVLVLLWASSCFFGF